MKWDPSVAKAHLQYTSQRLGQEQAKHNSQATLTRADIATLVQQGNVLLAREKAEKLVQEDGFNEVLGAVEVELGVILERFQELEERAMPSPALVEAASTIIYSAPYINSRDLDAVRNILLQHLGPDFTRPIVNNRDGYVSQRVLQAMSLPVPSAYHLDYVLHGICKNYGISWSPDPPPRDFIVNSLSECLDMEASPQVDLIGLRKLCLRGLPDEPGWLRPRIWKILFGLVSPTKSSWPIELSKQRDSYYGFVRRLLKPFSEFSENSHGQDLRISETYKELSGLPRNMFSLLEEEPENFIHCPLSDDAPDAIRIPYARILESRLNQLNEPEKERDSSPMPEIRLETEADVSTPGISITTFDSEIWENGSTPRTLLASRICMFGNAHAKHCSVLLRLLYLHNAVNPAKSSSHTASLLVPLYSAMLQEVDTEGLAHVEADTFWLLESVVAELSEVDEDGGQLWMAELGKRLAWADYDFFTELESQGLSPGLPHYSYRWLAPLLSHTLPLHALFQIWDALFSRDPRGKESNPKADHLVDICTSMILRGKNHLHRIWKAGQNSRSLWTNDSELSSTSRMQDPFLQSLSFLQAYDLKFVGGIDRILQTAAELAQRRHLHRTTVQSSTLGFTSRFNFWGSAIVSVTNGSQEMSGNRLPTEPQSKPRPNGLASQITTTVWRGITNQIAMEDENPSPPELDSPIDTQSPVQIPEDTGASSYSLPSSNIWDYTEKIKESDALAALSKVSTNWRAKGILSGWRSAPNSSTIVQPSNDVVKNTGHGLGTSTHPAKLSDTQGLLSPPSQLRELSPIQSPQSAGSLVDKTKSLFSARSLTPSTPKSGPKPLLLNSSRFTYTHSPRSSTDSTMNTPDTGGRDEWAEVMKLKRHHFHRESQSSASSLSPDAFIRNPRSARSDRESDTTTSRIVPLNRGAVSPMAPHYRRPSSRASSVSSDIHSPTAKVKSPLHESSSIDVLSKGKVPFFSEPESSDTTSYQTNIAVRNSSFRSDNIEDVTLRAGIPARSARVRTRRQTRPANLQIPDTLRAIVAPEPKSSESSKSLKVEWPTDNQDNVTTPRAANFDSEGHPPSIPSGTVRSPRRSTSKRDPERLRKVSTDNANDEGPRKVSTRSRKVSGETRDANKSRRTSAAEDGDDEGYDELLSAYESEDTNHLGWGPRR